MAKDHTYPSVLKLAKKVTDKTPLTKPGKFTVSTVAARLGSLDPTPPQVAEVVNILNKADPNRLGKQLLTGMVKAAAPAAGHRGGLVMEPKKALKFMNDRYAVTFSGGDVLILREHYDEELGYNTVSFIKTQKLELFYANWSVNLGGDKRVPLVGWWLTQPKRKTYKQVIFAPEHNIEDCYNLWRGWAVDPDPNASCELFLKHLHDVICSGDKKLSTWMLDWCADAIQWPNTKPGTALVLKGDEGIGKGAVAQYMGKLYGPHFVHLTHSDHLVGRFNSHTMGCAFMFGDECFFAGDKKNEGVLKGLITEPTVQVEMKFVDKFTVANRVRLIMASNSDWVVPAGMGARRFCVVNVPDTRMGDTKYFDALFAELDATGPAALMHYLLNRKITSDLRVVPKTEALLDQKVRTMTPVQAYWYGQLREGLDWEADERWVLTVEEYASFIRVCQDTGVKRRPDRGQFGRDLKKLCPLRKKAMRTLRVMGEDGYSQRKTGKAYGFPSLAECRKAFEKCLKQKIEWDEE